MKINAEKGFTLAELLIVVLLLPVLFLAVFSSMTMANVVFRTNNVYGALNQSAMQTMRYINREIGQSSPNASPSHLNITTSAGNSVVRFQIPVDWDNDGDVVTAAANPAVEWGAYAEANQKTNGLLSDWVRYSVANNQLSRDILDSTLTPVAGTSRVVANNVQSFTVTQASSALTMSITLQGSDGVGQSGTSRTLQTSFSSNTILRNAVS